MNSSKRVIKSKNIKVVDSPSTERARFEPASFGCENLSQAPAPRRSKIEEILIESEKKIEVAVKHAYERGHAEGFRKGTEMREKELASSAEALKKLILEVENIRRSILERGEARVLNLVIAVAGKIVRQEIATDRDVILGVLREAVKNVLDRDRIKIRLNPRDHERLSKLSPALISGFEGIRSISLEAVETISPGGAVIETAFGEVDATIEQQLEEVLKAFLQHGKKA
jgi:flagellar assembly protein FliH